MATHDPQMLKGVLSLLILSVLERHEDYGYSIVVRLKHLGFADLAEGTVYPALTRLEKRGLLSSRMVKSTSGPARKYYRLSEAGKQELETSATQWAALAANVERALTDSAPQESPATTTRLEQQR